LEGEFCYQIDPADLNGYSATPHLVPCVPGFDRPAASQIRLAKKRWVEARNIEAFSLSDLSNLAMMNP